jgi:hypothetical protein
MKSVVLSGPCVTQSGYGVHSRQVFRWLQQSKEPLIDLHVHLVPWGDTPWYIDRCALGGQIGRIMERTSSIDKKPDVTIQLKLPNEWDPKAGETNVGITAGVETDVCNPKWIDNINAMQLVIVPSEHVKKTFENTGKVTTKIAVIPESFADVFFR